MKTSTMWRVAVLGAAVLLVNGQLCMLTTCVPRLQRASSSMKTHACCHVVPTSDAPAPRAPAPMGAMPCDESLNLAGAPTLDAPAPAAMPVALATDVVAAATELESIAIAVIERDTGPAPGRHTPAPTGLRAPPRA